LRPLLSMLATTALLLQWQATTLRNLWKSDDYGNGGGDFDTVPIIDPDLLSTADFVSTSSAAYTLWSDRANWITGSSGPLAALQKAKQGKPDPNAALANVMNVGLPGVDFGKLESDLAGGSNIDDGLSQAHLTMPGFQRLSQLKALAGTGSLQPFEWDDV